MKIQVLDWNKYLGRKGIENPKWFSFQKALLNDSKYMGAFDPAMIAAFCYCCCQALGSDDGDAELNLKHAEAYTALTPSQFREAIKKLQQLQLVHIDVRPVHESVQEVNGARTQMGTVLHNKEGNDKEPQHIADVPPAQTTYEFFDQPKKKREKKPKPELSCDPIPAFKAIEEVLRTRKVPTLLQQKWEKLYHPGFVLREIGKAETWLISTGEEKKNYGQFFNGWLMRAGGGHRPSQPIGDMQAGTGNGPGSAPPERKKTWWEQQQDEADRKAAQGGAQ